MPVTDNKKFYLTKEGLDKIKKQYKDLKNLRLAKTEDGEVPKILESEDVNPEYLSFQEDLNFLETRLAELDVILKNTVLIKPPGKEKQSIVDIGARVTVQVNHQVDEFTIVGSLEADPAMGKISNESPVGRALLGHKVGDEIPLSSPIQAIYKVKKIRYLS
jgi:transcription elongation factor GreA